MEKVYSKYPESTNNFAKTNRIDAFSIMSIIIKKYKNFAAENRTNMRKSTI